ncbi:hypothetical protein [Haloimpatiens lingqiaonensis]|uniref:hypothetical protein n=1 Tax=Haloimpatiens lingqiaonensis TaxID=1380675 RepID=UPI0010FF21F3|nr:hypothetical protein [Haloimpatiens lingqiaonensis]
MKRIINDKIYDTDKAKLIITDDNGTKYYVTTRGAWFAVYDDMSMRDMDDCMMIDILTNVQAYNPVATDILLQYFADFLQEA